MAARRRGEQQTAAALGFRAVLDVCGGSAKAHDQDVAAVVRLAGALGVVVDAMILGLLHEKDVDSFSRRDLVLTMDRGLARGRREARQRRLDDGQA